MTAPRDDIAVLHPELPQWFVRAFDVPRVNDVVSVDGADINFFRWGNPDLPGIVLTHGFMAHARCWAFLAPLLADSYCLAAFDLSGMGDSGWRETYDVATRAAECFAVAEAAGLGDRPTLVCHSYGGSVGLTAAMQQADFWGALLVCDMAINAPGEESPFEARRQARQQRGVRDHTAHPNYEAIRQRFRLAPDQPCENTFLMDYMAFHSVRHRDDGYVWKFDPKIMAPDDERSQEWWQQIAPNFAALDLPRGIICGAQSQMMSDRAIEYVRTLTGGSVPIVKVPGAYHHIMMDQPIAFASVIDALLQALRQ